MPAIYALLVGINNYPVKPLQGCINDVKAVKEYLENIYRDTSLTIKTLTDDDTILPTRQNLIEAFDFFSQAKTGDYCLFYYSGHGSFSKAPDEINTSDGNIQSIVCIDSRLPGGKDLMDKEIGYLIWKTVQKTPDINFIAITDCCHSGTITKEFLDDSGIRDRMVSGEDEHVPATIQEYLGFDEAFEINASNGKYIAKQARHIHLAASKDNQTSKELSINGVKRGAFTHSLLKTLYTFGGQISYKDLIDQTSAFVKNLVPDQHPDLHINGKYVKSDIKRKIFLSDEILTSTAQYLVFHDPKYGWCIKAGLAQGVSKGDQVIITESLTSIITATPAPDFSIILSKPELGNHLQTYYAEIIRQPNNPLTISFSHDVPEKIRNLIEKRNSHKSTGFIELLSANGGQYYVHADVENKCYISLPGCETPLFKPEHITSDETADSFISNINNVARWKNLLELINPNPKITKEHYTIKLFVSQQAGNYDITTFREIQEIEQLTRIYYKQAGENWYQPAFRLSVTNHLPVDLFVTSAYLGFDYAISTRFFSDIHISPGRTGWLNFIEDSVPVDVIKMMIDPKYKELGYSESEEYIKLFISTQKIDTTNLEQAGLDLHVIHKNATSFTLRIPGEENKAVAASLAWVTENIGFRIIGANNEKNIDGTGITVNVGSVSITPPKGFTGKVNLSTSEHTAKSADMISAPHKAFRNSYLEPYDLNGGTRFGICMDVIEIMDSANCDLVSEEDPIRIELTTNRSAMEDEIIPIAYDSETGLYYPVGYTTENTVYITSIPAETQTDSIITQKSFLQSVKIYFQKIIGKKLGLITDYPRLATPEYRNNKLFYNNNIDELSEKVKEASAISLFIHGIIGDTEGMAACTQTVLNESGDTLSKKYELVLTFDYENLNTKIEDTARLLKNKLSQIGLGDNHGKQFTIIAHSMGGLVSRYFIENEGGDKVVTKLIMLGTPNNGTPWADVRDMAETLITYAINGSVVLKPWLFVLSLLRKTVKNAQITLKQMDKESDFYKVLNQGSDPGISYVIIAGNTQTILIRYDETAGLIKRLFTRIKKKFFYNTLDTILFKKPNDIAVTVESITSITGHTNWTNKPTVHIVDCDHLNYFNMKGVLLKL